LILSFTDISGNEIVEMYKVIVRLKVVLGIEKRN